MSLSIDYITMPPKSQEVSQIQRGEQVKYEQSQQQVESQFQQQIHQNSHQTVRRKKAENEEYTYDEQKGKGNGSKKEQKKKNNKEKQTDERSPRDPMSGGSFFDMKV